MRILYATQVDLDGSTGAARHVIAVARELGRLGHGVTLIAPGRLDVPGVRQRRPAKVLAPGARMELAIAAMATAAVARRRPDVAYVRMSASTSAIPATLAALRVPVILALNGPILDELSALGRSEAVVGMAQVSLRAAVLFARAVIAPLPSVGEHAAHYLDAEAVEIVENGADLDAAIPGDRVKAREAIGLPPQQKILGLVANLAPELRLDLLAEAHRKVAGVALLVVGDGAQQPFVQAMGMATRPSSPVLYLGRVPHPEAVRAVQACDVCINVRDGCLGTKSLEYAAVGRRQVAFDTEGADRIAALYEGLEATHLIRERSAGAVRTAIQAAFAAERTHGPLPGGAIAEARAKLGWAHTAADLARVIERYL